MNRPPMVLLGVKTGSGHHGDLQRASELVVDRLCPSFSDHCANVLPFLLPPFAARGRDKEEEGGSHRPGDHELGESVSARDQSLLGKKVAVL